MSQVQNLTIENQLKFETVRRIQKGNIFQILLISNFAYFYSSDFFKTFNYYSIALFIVIIISLRSYLFYKFKDRPEKIVNQFPLQMVFSLTASFCFGLLLCFAILYFSGNTEILIPIFVSAGLMTGSMSSMAPVPNYQKFYILVHSLPNFFALLYLQKTNPLYAHFATLYFIYVLYLIYSSKGINADLKNSYLKEFQSREQKETLQKVIDLVPGFVALADKNGNWESTSQSFSELKKCSELSLAFSQFKLSSLNKLTKEISWKYQDIDYAFIISFQKYPDQSMIAVGIPAEEIIEIRKELDKQRLKSEYSARLATLGEMAGGMAHEINNPLAVIIGNCNLALKAINQWPANLEVIKDKLDKISKTSFRINKIINGLRRFSRQSDNDPLVLTSISDLIEDTLELCRERFYQNNIEFKIASIPEIQVPMRMVQISQVLINLLNNAFDVIKNLDERFIELKFETTESHFIIYVINSGPKISESISAKIFEPFFTTKDVGQGTGLGLSISRSLLLDHNGILQLSENTNLTTFEIRLPLKQS